MKWGANAEITPVSKKCVNYFHSLRVRSRVLAKARLYRHLLGDLKQVTLLLVRCKLFAESHRRG